MRIIFLLLLLLVQGTPSPAAQNPQQSIREVQAAIDSKDGARFERLVDSEALALDAVKFFLEAAAEPEGQKLISPFLALMLSSLDSSEARRLIANELRAFVLFGVESGYFAGKPDQNSPAYKGSLLAPLFTLASTGRKLLRSSGPPAALNAEEVLLPVNLEDAEDPVVYPLLLRMRRGGEDWRVVQIVNMRDLWQLALDSAQKQAE